MPTLVIRPVIRPIQDQPPALTHICWSFSPNWQEIYKWRRVLRRQSQSLRHAGLSHPLCGNLSCFCRRCGRPRYWVQPVCECFWLGLNLTDSGVVFAAINVVCKPNLVEVTWTITPELVPYAARFFLGSCMPTRLNILPNQSGELYFKHSFDECKFIRKVMVIKFSLAVRMELLKHLQSLFVGEREEFPLPKYADLQAIFEIQKTSCLRVSHQLCSKKVKEIHQRSKKMELRRFSPHFRKEKWTPAFLNRGSGVSESWSGLVFHMALLNGEDVAPATWPPKGGFHPFFLSPSEHLTGLAKTNVVPLGSFMPIWAAVEQKSHQPLVLLMEECVAASTAELRADSRVYPVVTNKGWVDSRLVHGRSVSKRICSGASRKASAATRPCSSPVTTRLPSPFICSPSRYLPATRWGATTRFRADSFAANA